MKQKLILVILSLFALHMRGQIELYAEHFDGVAFPALPNGWLTTLNYDIGWRTDTTNHSDCEGASGLNHALIRNTDSTGVYTLTSPLLGTIGFQNVTLTFNARVSNNFFISGSSTPLLEISTNNGISWNPVAFTENEANSDWNWVNGGLPIDLPQEADDSPYLQFRWTVNILNGEQGTYRFDDVVVMAEPNPLIDVTLRVNMYGSTVEPDGVFVAGNFNGWESGALQMVNSGGSIYEYTIQTDPGTLLSYRFFNGSSSTGAELVPADCGADDENGLGELARWVQLNAGDTVMSTVCFSGCEDCVIVEPVEVQVTLSVDMSQQTVSSSGVHVMGNFNNWDPSATPLDNLGNGIYSVTLSVTEGTEFYYRFVNGDNTGATEVVPSLCGFMHNEGGMSRLLFIGQEDISAELVCYSECAACIQPHVGEQEMVQNIFPNPFNEIIHVVLAESLPGAEIQIIDASGRVVLRTRSNGIYNDILVGDIQSGVYFLRIVSGSKSSSSLLMKN
jgi:hypothetical protein